MLRAVSASRVGRRWTSLLWAAVLVPLLFACAPPATTTQPGVDSDLHRVAVVAFHRMEIGLLETGAYTTNALIDLEIPRHVRWTLEEFGEGGYRIRFTSDSSPGEAWLVTPAGVSAARDV